MKLEKPNGDVCLISSSCSRDQEVSLSPHCSVSTAGNIYLSIHVLTVHCSLKSSLPSVVHLADKINSCSGEFRVELLLQTGDLLDKAVQKAS